MNLKGSEILENLQNINSKIILKKTKMIRP